MSIVKKSNPNDLTDDEIGFLRGASIAPEVKHYLSRQHENIGMKVSAYRKVAAAASAECEALLAVRSLSEVQGEMTELTKARQTINALQMKVDALETTEVRQEVARRQLTALPAMAVHSDD